MTDWTTPDDVPADTIDRLHRWLLQEGNPADAATPGERAVADIIRAFWPVPATTLAEELRELNKRDIPLGALLELAARADQIEQDRDDAIEEVERQVKIADGLRTTAGMAQRERDALRNQVNRLCDDIRHITTERMELKQQLDEARQAAEGHAQDAMDAADERDQLRDELRAITTGRTFTTPDLESEIVSTLDTALRTVLARLHVTTRRIITNPDELHQLATTSIIRDGRGWPGGVTDQGVMMINGFSVSDEEVLSHGPVTVLWEPDA